ncbi:MAG TPA: hypothetical protein VMT63_07530 [Bacteroidales bacterium]|nr:hypothetical protein [Bacteroidales bacterium]
MKKFLLHVVLLVLILFCISVDHLFSQDNSAECKVLLKEISGSYTGGCRDGLADGKGVAKGEDTYEGVFKNGLPEGKGTYTFKNGTVYTGFFTAGLKNGKGKLKTLVNGKPMIMEGYWKYGEYAGTTAPDDDYRIINLSGIEHFSIKRTDDRENIIEVTFVKYQKKYLPRDLGVTITSGYKSDFNLRLLVQKYALPETVSLQFTIPLAAGVRICNFGLTVLRPGKYEILIENN